MPFLKNHNHKKLKLILLSAIVSALGITLAVFITHRNSLDKKGHVVSTIRSKANISIGKAHQTAIRNGIKEWNLDAASVNYMVEKTKLFFGICPLLSTLKIKAKFI